jgi:S1-C subfamily serine protease
MMKNVLRIIAFFVIGIVGGIFADQILWPYFIERPLFYEYRLEKNPIYVTERKEITITENIALQNAIEKVEKVVVGVKTKTKAGKFLEGSGLIITSDGLLVTLADLVPQGSTFSFFVDGKGVRFQILKRDLKENLALVKIEESNLSTVSFADFDKVKLGQRVFLVGVVFEEIEIKKTVNEGIIKNFDSDLIETNILEGDVLTGSALFNIEGYALGLNQANKEGKIVTIPITKIREFAGF